MATKVRISNHPMPEGDGLFIHILEKNPEGGIQSDAAVAFTKSELLHFLASVGAVARQDNSLDETTLEIPDDEEGR
jgi:hypothetical protein